jgi:sulfur relay (sulfurtransferase) DsrC/TusE family protein
MTANSLVKVWADWSRRLWRAIAEEKGPQVMVDHDARVELLKSALAEFKQPTPDVSTFVAMMVAKNLLATDDDLDPATQQLVDQKMHFNIGLVAEALMSRGDNVMFDKIVAQDGDRNEARRCTIVSPLARTRERLVGTFSCNSRGEVWRPTGFGLTATHERVNLSGRDRDLDAAVRRVLAIRAAGGRFEINDRGVFLADGYREVA